MKEEVKKDGVKALSSEKPKAEHKDKKEKHGHVHKMEIEKKDGGYLSRLHHKPEAGGAAQDPTETVHPHMDSVVDHLQANMGEPNPGEAEADAGNAGLPAGMPGPAAAAV